WEQTMMRPDPQDPNDQDMKPWKSLNLLEFARRLGLYQAVELEEDGFNVYFEGGLHNDDNFNAQDYWLSISREDNLSLSRSYTSTIRRPILRLIYKMITYDLCQRTTGYDKVQKNDLWLLSMFDARHQNRVLTEDVVRSLSASVYCRDLDSITLRDLIDYDGKLIPEDPQPGVPRVGIPRPPRASMQDLYDRMVFEHMAGVYSVPLQGAYNPPGYAQPQYDQYYQQYQPSPLYYSSKNSVRKFLRALHPKWRAKVMAIEESKDLTPLSLDELIGNLKVYEMIIKKDSEIVKAKVERKSLALKAKKESSDEECSTSRSEDEEYAMATFQRSRDNKNGKSDRKCFRCGDPNHLIGECPKPPKDKNQRALVGGSWSDSGEEDDEKVNNKTCLVAQASSEVCSKSSYFSDENSSIDDLVLDNEYDKLCKMSLKIITKNKRLKATRNNLEKELSVLKEKVSTLEKNKGVDLECVKCHMLKIENEKLKEEVTRLNKFKKSTQCLNEMLSNQKPSGEKLGLGFNSFEASSSGTKEIKFVKAQKKASSDGGPINMGGPQSVQAPPKTIMGPPPVGTPRSEKSVSFQKSILGPRPKHIIVNNVKVPVAK
ncbi:zf-CCHC domain-containing protein, partial [Tanacetum coccineum]